MGLTVRRPPSGALSLLVLLLVGCGGATAPSEGPGPVLGESGADIRIANSLSTDALVLNAIATNGAATTLLATSALQDLFDSDPMGGNAHINKQMHDPDAQKFMEYLVSCALGPNQSLDYYNPRGSSAGPGVWEGKAGLCTQWLTSAPSQACLNRVSGCLLARNNALGRRVELSIRGEVYGSPGIFYLEPMTRPAEHDPVTAQKLDSFAECTGSEVGAQRDCGWTADGIGACIPGTTVWVGAGGAAVCPGPSLGSTLGSPTVLRVCSGVVGCDSSRTTTLAEADGSCSGADPAVSFTCPVEGYFSVMSAPWSSDDVGIATVAAMPTNVSRYGLSEKQVFAVREGAFYGNIFDAKSLATEVDVKVVYENERPRYFVVGDEVVIEGAIYRGMYSCYDPAWASGAAYSTYRVCALPGAAANCAATVVGPCWSTPLSTNGKCAVNDGPQVPGDGDFELCKDTLGRVWREPVTTFLHDPCGPVAALTSKAKAKELCTRTARTKVGADKK